MSWQAFSDRIIENNTNVSGAIIGLNDKSIWAQSGKTVNTNEASSIVDLMASKAPGGRVQIAGDNYMVLRFDELDGMPTAYLKCGPSKGGAICMTTQACVVGLYGENMQAGISNESVYRSAKYLKDTGY